MRLAESKLVLVRRASCLRHELKGILSLRLHGSLILQMRRVFVAHGVLQGVVVRRQQLASAVVLIHDFPQLRPFLVATRLLLSGSLQVDLLAHSDLRNSNLVLLTAMEHLNRCSLLPLPAEPLTSLGKVAHPLNPHVLDSLLLLGLAVRVHRVSGH